MGLLTNGKSSEVSVLNDPFKSEKVEAICIFIYPSGRSLTCRASVDFKNGDTEGTQNFETQDYNQLVSQIETFLASLKK